MNRGYTDDRPPIDDAAELRRRAMDMLARREHSGEELVNKLRNKGADVDVARTVVDRLRDENLVSDERFAESLVIARRHRGRGPVRIRRELEEKGVAESLIDGILAPRDRSWTRLAAEVRQRKFGETLPTEFRERARQARFLQYRGFTADQVQTVLAADAFADEFE